MAFFDVYVTSMQTQLLIQTTPPREVFARHEQKRKRTYLQGLTAIEPGSFTPRGFGTNGGTGKACETLLRKSASQIAD